MLGLGNSLFITMKKVFLFVFTIIAFVACTPVEEVHEVEKAHLSAASIADGDEVRADGLQTISLSFFRLITVAHPEQITLNQQPVEATINPGDKKQVVITMPTLEDSTQYVLHVAEGALLANYEGELRPSEEITIHFSTKPAVVQHISRLTNPNATQETLALYERLQGYYGKKTLSGMMCDNLSLGTSEFIKRETGHYPMVVGIDYLHIGWEPCNWINYGDISTPLSVRDNGGIVQVGWHWNVPERQDFSRPDQRHFYNDDFKKAGYPVFSAKEAVKEGTWQHEIVIADLAKLAGRLQLLADENIPVLFRPLHEAAGDYQWGSWFWWGYEGADACKALWRLMYDELVNRHHLNNLIWVWTVQTSRAGKLAPLSDLQAWYPGDDVVDIVGADLYINSMLTTQKPVFDLVNQLVEGRKMVALTECGNLLDFERCLQQDEHWLYFMQWCQADGYPSWNSKDVWVQVMSSPNVVSRD